MSSVRVFIITVDDPVYAPVYLTKIIQKNRHSIVGISALSPVGQKGWFKFAKKRLALYGPLDFLRAASLYGGCRLRSLLPPTRNSDRFYSVNQVASRYSIPLYPCTNVNAPSYLDTLDTLKPDIIVSVAATQRFKERLLKTPRMACLNVHSALLPKYRGIDGLFWALVHEETEVGVTVHLMNEAFDDGAIVAQQAFSVAEKDTLHNLYQKAIEAGSSLVARAIDDFANGTVDFQPNDIESGSYFSAPTPEAVQHFRKLGRRFF